MSLIIKSAQGDYSVDFLSKIAEVRAPFSSPRTTCFVIDRNVYELHRASLEKVIGDAPFLLFSATEEEKTLLGIQKVTSWMQSVNCAKNSSIYAFGGGIIQDIVTFSAHVYYRGVQWHFLPTTLLSMADSCIGAKCGINLNQYKNQLGVFHSPSSVTLCSEFIDTLRDQDVASGYGEVLKLCLTAGSWEPFHSLDRSLLEQGLRGRDLMGHVRKSLEVKKAVIEADEYEANYRRVLNYGHSFGHSLEAITHHEIPHGLAVAWGMDLINYLGWQRGLLDEAQFQRIHQFIRRHLPFKLSCSINAEELIKGAKRDKKAESDSINLVFLTREGKLQISKTAFDGTLLDQVDQYLRRYDVYYRD